jgi:hypothetical protein
MAITIYPTPTAAPAGTTFNIPLANTLYKASVAFASGVYRVDCVSTTITRVELFSGTTKVTEVLTVSGTISFILSQSVDTIYLFTNTGTNIVVNITLVGANGISNSVSGTLDTLTNSQTYTQTGMAYVVVVGAGGGGAGGGSAGGGSGGVQGSYFLLSGNTSVTIGARGNAGNSTQSGNYAGGNNGGAGGATIFGNLTSNGGGGGTGATGNSGTFAGGAAGTPGGGRGGDGNTTGGNANSNGIASSPSPYPFVKSGTTGGGASGNGSPAGSGIGTGGNSSGGSASGYGAGGGAAATSSGASAGVGTQGVVYVIRGI